MLTLYSNIKKYRLDSGMSQSELAAKVGYADKTMISRIENGLVDLPQSKIEEFAKVFNVEPGVLMGWTDGLDKYRESIIKDQLELFSYEGNNIEHIDNLQRRLNFTTELYHKLLQAKKQDENEYIDNKEFREEMKKALELYNLYENADPRIKAAVESLLKGPQ